MRTPLTQTAIVFAVLAGATTLAVVPAAPHDHDHDHDHDHAPASTAPAAAAAHDHDHDHDKPAGGDAGHGGHTDEIKLTDAAVRQHGVRVAAAETKNLAAGWVAPGRVSFDADAVAHVGPAVSGRVVVVKARVGDTVKKDDELFVVESAEFGRAQSDFLQRRVEADVAAGAVAPLKDAYDRAKALFDESQSIPLPELQKREIDYRAAVGQAATSKAALQSAENSLRLYGLGDDGLKTLAETNRVQPRFGVRSPINGTVIDRRISLGEWISPEKERPLVVADTRTLWVVADVPEAKLIDVGVGSKADLRLAAMPAESVGGAVSLVLPEVDAHTRTAQVRVVVQNPDGRLRPGMFASVHLQGRSAEAGSVVVPEGAVQTVEGKVSVFVPVDGEPNTFTPRPVTVGKPVDGFVAVTSGLKAGEPVVVSGSFVLKAELGKSEAGHEH